MSAIKITQTTGQGAASTMTMVRKPILDSVKGKGWAVQPAANNNHVPFCISVHGAEYAPFVGIVHARDGRYRRRKQGERNARLALGSSADLSAGFSQVRSR
jgi:hypothetical protein